MAKKALVVDDVAYTRQFISGIIENAQYIVAGHAADGNEAIEKFKELRPDFVIMDVVMPKRSGIEACRTIIEKNPEAKIILLSGLNHEQLLMDAVNAGARDYILKPFEAIDLIRSIQKALEDEPEGDSSS